MGDKDGIQASLASRRDWPSIPAGGTSQAIRKGGPAMEARDGMSRSAPRCWSFLLVVVLALLATGCAGQAQSPLPTATPLPWYATTAADPGWQSLQQRALHLPALTPGAACPTTHGHLVQADLGIGLGSGPAYPILGEGTSDVQSAHQAQTNGIVQIVDAASDGAGAHGGGGGAREGSVPTAVPSSGPRRRKATVVERCDLRSAARATGGARSASVTTHLGSAGDERGSVCSPMMPQLCQQVVTRCQFAGCHLVMCSCVARWDLSPC